MSVAILFFHSGVELPQSMIEKSSAHARTGSVPWNGKRHYRRFLNTPGRYLLNRTNQKVLESDLEFWGEWEAPTSANKLAEENQKCLPRWIHTPKSLQRPQNVSIQKGCGTNKNTRETDGRDYENGGSASYLNTDPCIFGDAFFYSNCLQGRSPLLRSLSRGDVVLFGSQKAGKFIIDTVFVVGEVVARYWGDEAQESVGKLVPNWYYTMTLDLLPHKEFVLYRGATYDNPVLIKSDENKKMYSFFPCLTNKNSRKGFCRPAVPNVETRKTQGITRLSSLSHYAGMDNFAIWSEIADSVTENGLHLGIKAELPQSVITGSTGLRKF